jgi:glycine/D-amino acid oxidase-like deaminating enzyme
VHGGHQGLAATNKLVKHAKKYKPDCVLRDEIYRVALNEKHVEQLQKTATTVPEYCEWISKEEMQQYSQYALGGLRLANGCKVIHVPTYLEGLWMACQELSQENGSMAVWTLVDDATLDWKKQLDEFDAVVLAAGAGLFHDSLVSEQEFPIDLIRGQSIEMNINKEHYVSEALLCGKYISPLPEKNRLLIGATHEYKAAPLSETELVEDLKERSYELAPNVWDYGTVDKITSGYRVQSRRGAFGRAPIIGKLLDNDSHSNVWIFTGLSSRGLLYHGLYGDILTDAILGKRNETLWNEWKLDWWRNTK